MRGLLVTPETPLFLDSERMRFSAQRGAWEVRSLIISARAGDGQPMSGRRIAHCFLCCWRLIMQQPC